MSEDSKDRGKSSISLILPIIVFYVVLMAVIVLFSVVLFKNGLVSFKTKSVADVNQSESVSEVIVETEAEELRSEDSKANTLDSNASESINDEATAETNSTEADTTEISPGEIASSTSYVANTDLSGSTSLSPERLSYISNLSLTGSGYEGIKGTGKYNYGEALQKSILFYELQRSGKLPDNTRTNWRGDSCLKDGADNGLDLTGGLFDAGDHVKFNLPMAYTCAMLSWSMVEDPDAYEDSKQKEYALNNIRFICDYFIKCHPEDEVYYYQVGDGGQDHSWWGPAEALEARMDRPSYKVTASNPGSCVTGETAAAMAAASIVFEKEDPEYSKLLLSHAKSLYAFADKYKSDSGYTAANGYYTSWSGFNDELAFAGAWLYKATKDKDYLKKAEEYFSKTEQNEKWAQCWDDVTVGAALMLSDLTGDSKYTGFIEKHLDYWTTGNNGQKIQYSPKGLAWLDNWGSLRYATTTGFIAAVYSESKNCPKTKKDTYWNFAVSQADYALGSSGRSFVCGYGENPPVHPHHRTAQGSYANDMNTPKEARHILVGALVGGPDAGDNYNDEVSDYNKNEVACDYNAGFTGLLAKLYTRYHGETLKNFGAVETPENEIFCEAGINVNGNDFVEIKAFVYNESAWPARVSKDLEMRYYVDLSEVYDAGGSASDIEITTNYIQNAWGNGLTAYDEDKHIYYVSISFDDGALYPGGQESFKKEVQFRIRSINGVWDNSNDYSFEGLPNNNVTSGDRIAIYEGGKLIYGSEP